MDNVLVTGGAGFIGSHVAMELAQTGYHVVVLDDLSGGRKENVPDAATFIQGTVLDRDLLDRLFSTYSFKYVFHFAAYAAEGLSHFIKHFNYENNLIGSVNLINQSVNHDVACFVFTSSLAVYGKGQTPMQEEMIPAPEDSYGIAKYAVELELRASHEMFGLNYVIFRPHNVYGERQNIGDRYRNVIGIFMNQIMQGQPMTIFGDGAQTRAFTYVGDIAPLIASSIRKPNAYNQVFNVGADQAYSVNELAEMVAHAMGTEPQIQHLDARNEVTHAFSSHEKITSVFGRLPQTGLSVGLKNMADWVKKVGPQKSSPFKAIEISKNLPPSWRD
jgi:UDP-glucose 4-epimerase